ncbi:uncharacterized protein LOC143219560 [Lasioglossum baleicum]
MEAMYAALWRTKSFPKPDRAEFANAARSALKAAKQRLRVKNGGEVDEAIVAARVDARENWSNSFELNPAAQP